jgi:hypothetical protein
MFFIYTKLQLLRSELLEHAARLVACWASVSQQTAQQQPVGEEHGCSRQQKQQNCLDALLFTFATSADACSLQRLRMLSLGQQVLQVMAGATARLQHSAARGLPLVEHAKAACRALFIACLASSEPFSPTGARPRLHRG